MSAHTSAPWVIETVRTSVGLCHKIGPFPWKDGKQNHACIYVDYPGDGVIEAELRANARLIAAAPDLFAALEQIADETGATWVQDIARGALAKATGASHE